MFLSESKVVVHMEEFDLQKSLSILHNFDIS